MSSSKEPKFQLRRGGYAIRKSQIKTKEKKQLMKDLNVIPRVRGSITGIPPSPFPVYRESLTRFYVPRHYGVNTFGIPSSNVLSLGEKCPNLIFGGSLRDKQKPIVRIFQKSKGGGVLSVPCGFGKTCCAIYLACWLKRKTLVVVHKNFLLSQWVERIQQFAPTARIGRIQGKVVDIENKDIVIGMLQSLSQKDYEPKVFKDFGFTVVDECFPYQQNVITENGCMKIGKMYNEWKLNKSLPKVKSYNIKTQKFEFKDVTYSWKKTHKGKLMHIKVGRNVYKCTENHRFLTDYGWKKACDLSTNDRLISNLDHNSNKNYFKVLNDDQKQIVLGSYLGDGNIQLFDSNKFRLRVIHSIKQQQYCEWKANMFQTKTYIKDKNGYAMTPAIHFTTEVFTFNPNYMFPSCKSTIPKWLIKLIDPRAFAIWFMDDGSMNQNSYSITLHTQAFDEESQKLLVLSLYKYNIQAKYYITHKKDKSYYYIRLNKENSIRFMKLIKPYIHKSMEYKCKNTKFYEYSMNTRNTNTKYYNAYNIPNSSLSLNSFYTIHRRNGTSYKVKYINCSKCKTTTFATSDRGYYYCKHKSQIDKKLKDTLLIRHIQSIKSDYLWNNQFKSYGYLVINSISTKDSSEFVYDIEVKDNHNFIICGSKSSYGAVVHNCHHISAEVFSRALPMLGSRWNLGLSATPDRADGLSKIFYWHLGPLLYPQKHDIKVKPEVSGDEHSTQCIVKKIEYYHEDPSYSQEPVTAQGKPNTARMITQVCDWHRRNLLIMEILKMCIEKKRVILLLSDRRQMLDNLQTMIRLRMPSVSVGQYVGGMKQRLLDESAKCDIILSTYAMSSEGMDIPRINTVVLASPKSNVEQSVGRAQRKVHKEGVWLFDIVDMFSLFPRQWERRKAFYRKYVKTDSYSKQRYPIELYRINDEHSKPVELLRSAMDAPISVTKTKKDDMRDTIASRKPRDEIPRNTLSFVEEL